MPGVGMTTGYRSTSVIDFKREVYRMALTELARFINLRTPRYYFGRPRPEPVLEPVSPESSGASSG
jgi:hypothetical protein